MKSIGDFRPAFTIRDKPFEAPMADSKVMAEGSNGFSACFLNGDDDLDPGFQSCQGEPEWRSVPLRACLRDPPRVAAEGGLVGVSAETKVAPGSLSLEVNIVDAVDEVGRRASSSSTDTIFNGDCDRNAESPGDSPEEAKLFSVTELVLSTWVAAGSSLTASSGLDLKALNTSTGKSATPIVKLAIVPRSAEAPPEIGSQGPSSVSYSRARYLHNQIHILENCFRICLQLKIGKVEKAFVGKNSRS